MGVIRHALLKRNRTYILAKDGTLAIAILTARDGRESMIRRSLGATGELKALREDLEDYLKCEEKGSGLYMGRMPMLIELFAYGNGRRSKK